jgi:hypothetical protein
LRILKRTPREIKMIKTPITMVVTLVPSETVMAVGSTAKDLAREIYL